MKQKEKNYLELIDIKNLYRFPWTKNDGPCGWLEITTYCNMGCPGCYRGCDIKKNKEKHKSIDELKKEVLLMKKIKNCETMCISGGEPLMHPGILELISFIKENDMKPLIFTNGVLLEEKFLRKLKKAGLAGADIRIDTLRYGQKKETEKELNALREKYVKLFAKVKDLTLMITLVVSKENLSEINDTILWAQKHSEDLQSLVFIAKRQTIFKTAKEYNPSDFIDIPDYAKTIYTKFPDLKYAAFTGSALEDIRIKWLFAFSVFLGDELLGYSGKKSSEVVQMLHHLKYGRYLYLSYKKEHFFTRLGFPFFLLFCKEHKILKKYFKTLLRHPLYLLKKPHFQQLIFLNPPDFVKGKRDICDPCNCASIYDGKLLPSCGIEEYKYFGEDFCRLDKNHPYFH